MIQSPSELSNIEAEQYLLGGLLVNNKAFDSIGSQIKADHFAEPLHGRIFEVIAQYADTGQTANPATLRHRFDLDPALVDIGGGAYLGKLAARAHAAGGSLSEYASLIYDLSKKREISRLLGTWASRIEQQSELTSSEVINELQETLEKIYTAGDMSKFKTDKQVTQEIIARLQNPKKPFSTGIGKLDTAMEGGIYPGMNYLFAARKKVGKTSLAATLSHNLGAAGVKHLFICAEMSAPEIHQRILARQAECYTSAFRSEYGKSEQFHKKLLAASERSNGCIIFQSAPGITFDDLRSTVAQAISIHGIKGFILDSLQLVGGKQSKTSTSEHQDAVAQWCADYGRKRGVFSLVNAQINQTGGIRGGEGIRLACDQGYEIHAPDGDPSRSSRWLEMIETRYTSWMNIGSEDSTGLLMHEYGQYFYEPEIHPAQNPKQQRFDEL